MKQYLLFTLVLLLNSCDNTPNKPADKDIIKSKFEKLLLVGLDDPQSYKFDTILHVHYYTKIDQYNVLKNKALEMNSYFENAIKTEKNNKLKELYNNDKFENDNFLKKIDTLLSKSKSNDTIACCYLFSFRVNNMFGGKVRTHAYILADKHNEIIYYFLHEDKPLLSIAMILPILYVNDYKNRIILRDEWYSILGITEECDYRYFYEFKDIVRPYKI